MFLYALYFGAISVLLPYLGAAFQLGASVSGRLFPAQFTGFILGVLTFGFLSDRWGRKKVILVGIAAYTLGLVLFGFAPLFSLALAAAFLIGAGSGAMETVASALAADLYPEKRAFILNAIQVAFGVGASLGPWLAQRLLAAGIEWRWWYAALAALNIALFALLVWQPAPNAPHADEAVDFAALGRIARQPAFLALCLAQSLYVGAEVGYASWMPTYFQRSLPGGAAWEGLVVTCFWIAMTVGRILVTRLSVRTSPLRLTLLLTLGATASSLATLFWRQPLPVTLCVAFTGFFYSGVFGLLMAEAAERYPEASGSAFGGIMASAGVGGAVLPWIMGVVSDTSLGWGGALALIPVATFAIVPLALTIPRLRTRGKEIQQDEQD